MSRPVEFKPAVVHRDVPRFEPSMLLQFVAVKVSPHHTSSAAQIKQGVVFNVGRLMSYTASQTRTTFILEGDHLGAIPRVASDSSHDFRVDTLDPWTEPSDELQEKSA